MYKTVTDTVIVVDIGWDESRFGIVKEGQLEEEHSSILSGSTLTTFMLDIFKHEENQQIEVLSKDFRDEIELSRLLDGQFDDHGNGITSVRSGGRFEASI